jgi:5-methylcytosine-specific restriction enzyme A
MRLKVCAGCFQPFPVEEIHRGNGRCPACAKGKQRDKNRRRTRSKPERRRRQMLITEHVRTNGWVCPGWNRAAHPSTDLTADHVDPVASGGPEEGTIRVLCHSSTSARGADNRRRDYSPKPRFSRQQLTGLAEGGGHHRRNPPPATPSLGFRETHSRTPVRFKSSQVRAAFCSSLPLLRPQAAATVSATYRFALQLRRELRPL